MEPRGKTKILYGWVLPTVVPPLAIGVAAITLSLAGLWAFLGVSAVLCLAGYASYRNSQRKIREREASTRLHQL